MKDKIIRIVTDLVREDYSALDLGFETEAQALAGAVCTVPALGRIIDSSENVELLMSGLRLGSADFSARYRSLASVPESERLRILDVLETHLDQCPRCSRRRAFDLALAARVEKTLMDHKEVLLNALGEYETTGDNDLTEDDHFKDSLYPQIEFAPYSRPGSHISSPGSDKCAECDLPIREYFNNN